MNCGGVGDSVKETGTSGSSANSGGKGGGIYAKPAATINCASGKSTEIMLEVLLLQKQLYFKQEKIPKAQLLGCLPVEAPARAQPGAPAPWGHHHGTANPPLCCCCTKGGRGDTVTRLRTHTQGLRAGRGRAGKLRSSPFLTARRRSGAAAPPRPSRRRLRGARGAPPPPQPGRGAGSAAAARGMRVIPSRLSPHE